MTVVCYRTKEPVVYNRGTKSEERCDSFLSYYTYKTPQEAQKEVDTINSTKPDRLCNGDKVDWSVVKEFFVDEQEEMY